MVTTRSTRIAMSRNKRNDSNMENEMSDDYMLEEPDPEKELCEEKSVSKKKRRVSERDKSSSKNNTPKRTFARNKATTNTTPSTPKLGVVTLPKKITYETATPKRSKNNIDCKGETTSITPERKKSPDTPRRNKGIIRTECAEEDIKTENVNEAVTPKRNKGERPIVTVLITPKKSGTPKSQTPSRIVTPPSIRKKSGRLSSSIDSRTQPIYKSLTRYDIAREQLRLEEVPINFPCREKEYDQVYNKVKESIDEFKGRRMFISGQPGTGKTATVRQVIKNLNKEVYKKELRPFEFVEINGMEVKPPEKVYSVLWEGLTCDRISHKDAESLLDGIFNDEDNQVSIVFMIDEFDSLISKRSVVFNNLLEWSALPNSGFVLIALTNEIRLPHSLLTKSQESKFELERLDFEPYTHEQLFTILKSRLENIDIFAREAVEFTARKVSAISQDARNALCICRYAVGVLEAQVKNKLVSESSHVTIQMVLEAIEKTNTPWKRYISRSSLRVKIFLCSLLLLKKGDKVEIELKAIIRKYYKICEFKGISSPSSTELMDIAYDLLSSSMLIMDPNKDIDSLIDFNGIESDVNSVLSNDLFFKELFG